MKVIKKCLKRSSFIYIRRNKINPYISGCYGPDLRGKQIRQMLQIFQNNLLAVSQITHGNLNKRPLCLRNIVYNFCCISHNITDMIYKCRIMPLDYRTVLSGKQNIKIRRFSDLRDNTPDQVFTEKRAEDNLSVMDAEGAVFRYI